MLDPYGRARFSGRIWTTFSLCGRGKGRSIRESIRLNGRTDPECKGYHYAGSDTGRFPQRTE
jgi:hypothetical protein